MTLSPTSARAVLLAAVQPLVPAQWQLVTDESAQDDVQLPRVTLSQRTIGPATFAGTAVHVVGFTVTVTVPDSDLGAAEDALDDDIEVFIWALDSARVLWTEATKGLYDGRLGYQLGVQITTNRESS